MSVTCPPGSICSNQSVTIVDGKPYYTFTSTKVTQGSDGKVNGGETTLYYSQSPNNYVPAAKTKDGAKTWEYLTYQSGQSIPGGKKEGDTIMGAGLKKSLQEGALKASTNNSLSDATRRAGIPPEQSKSLNLNNKTQATVDPNEAGSTAAITSDQILSAVGSERGRTRNQFPGAAGSNPLKYPLNLKSEFQDVIKFKMVKYQPKSFSNQTFGFNPREKVGSKNREIIGTVVLPIPSGISDTNAVTWGSQDMNAALAAVANAALSGIKEGGEGLGSSLEATANIIAENSGDVKTAVAAAFTQAATGVTGILARTTGLIVNPNMELLFNAPTLRPFNFTFKLSARSSEEAKAIRSIIRFFKQGMSPIRTESNLFLKSPHTFQLEYLHRNKSHNYLNTFKECALQSFSVDYTPEGQYATFTDGAMVSYQITMQFQELEPLFNDDYPNDNDASIGF